MQRMLLVIGRVKQEGQGTFEYFCNLERVGLQIEGAHQRTDRRHAKAGPGPVLGQETDDLHPLPRQADFFLGLAQGCIHR